MAQYCFRLNTISTVSLLVDFHCICLFVIFPAFTRPTRPKADKHWGFALFYPSQTRPKPVPGFRTRPKASSGLPLFRRPANPGVAWSSSGGKGLGTERSFLDGSGGTECSKAPSSLHYAGALHDLAESRLPSDPSSLELLANRGLNPIRSWKLKAEKVLGADCCYLAIEP